MEPTHRLGQERDELEEQRVLARRARDAARVQRFKTMRQYGVDPVTVEAQRKETQRRKQEDLAASREFAKRMEEVSVEVERERFHETERKKALLQSLRREWDEHRALPKNNAPRLGEPVDPAKCGAAATQNLDGGFSEKHGGLRHVKEANQKRQMRHWQVEAVALKKAEAEKAREAEERFCEWERRVLAERNAAELREKTQAREARQKLRDEYVCESASRKMEQREAKRQNEAASALEIAKNLNDPMLNEAPDALADGRVRVDHFRGLSKGQTKAIYLENELLKEAKAQLVSQEKAYDEAFADHLRQVQSALVAAEHERSETRKAHLKQVQRDHLHQQLAEKNRHLQSKTDAFGSVDPRGGLLHGFGASFR